MNNKADLWWDYGVAKAEKQSKNGGDWSKLLQVEREVAALWKFQADVLNGGFLQFFCNWGYDTFQYAITALERIRALQTLQLTKDAYAVISRLENEKMDNIWDIHKLLTDLELEKLEMIDKQLWDCAEETAELAYDYFCATVP